MIRQRVHRLFVLAERERRTRPDDRQTRRSARRSPIEVCPRRQLDRLTHNGRPSRRRCGNRRRRNWVRKPNSNCALPRCRNRICSSHSTASWIRAISARACAAPTLPASARCCCRKAAARRSARSRARRRAARPKSLFIVTVSNLVRRLEWLKEQGVWVVGAAGDARCHVERGRPVAGRPCWCSAARAKGCAS